MTVNSLHCVNTFFAVELPIPKPNMATLPVVAHPSNVKQDDETEGREKLSMTPNNEAMLGDLFCPNHATKKQTL